MAPRIEPWQPGTFTRQPWNQVQGSRKQVQATRNLNRGASEPRTENQKVNAGNQVPRGNHGTKSTHPGSLMRQPWNQVKGSGCEFRHPETFTRQPWNHELNPGNQETSPGNHDSSPGIQGLNSSNQESLPGSH